MLDTHVFSTSEEVVSLASRWDKLQTFLDAPVAKFDWFISCAEYLLDDSSLYISATNHDETLVAIAPLKRPGSYFRAFQQIGVIQHGEPGDFLYQDEESLEKLSNILAGERIPLVLMRVPEESPVVSALSKAYNGKALINCRPQVSCPFIEINPDSEHVLSKLPSRLRSDLRRALRKAKALGEVSYEIHSPVSLDEMTPLWKEALKIEASGWKGRSHTALAEDQSMASFFYSYMSRVCQQGILRICFMRLNSQAVAMQIAIEASNRFWLLKIGYNENYAKCSPGMLLMLETLQYATRNNLSSYEFLGTANEWTRRWTKDERSNVTIRIYPYTLRGIAILAHDASTFLWRRMGKMARKLK